MAIARVDGQDARKAKLSPLPQWRQDMKLQGNGILAAQ